MTRSTNRLLAGLTVLLSVLTGLAGCSGGSAPGPGRPSASVLPGGVAGLDRAIAGINAARGALVADMNAVVAAANNVDSVDAVSVSGDWRKAAKVRAGASVDVPATTQVVSRLPGQVAAYTAALNTLAAAASARGVPSRPAEAVRQVVAVGRAEAAADDAFVRAVVTAWPAYAVLSGRQQLWYERATSGWYASTKLAAQEYAVLTAGNRGATTRSSQLFASTDQARRDAAQTWAETLQQIEPILHP